LLKSIPDAPRDFPAHVFLNASNAHLLRGLDFVFICVDKGRRKKKSSRFLRRKSISFIDVGMVSTSSRTSCSAFYAPPRGTPTKRDHLKKLVSFDDGKDDDYSTNIQIADLNMLNAALP